MSSVCSGLFDICNVVKGTLYDISMLYSSYNNLTSPHERIIKMPDEKLAYDNIISSLTRVAVQTKNSERAGNDYTVIELTFHDGYKYMSFLNSERRQLVK